MNTILYNVHYIRYPTYSTVIATHLTAIVVSTRRVPTRGAMLLLLLLLFNTFVVVELFANFLDKVNIDDEQTTSKLYQLLVNIFQLCEFVIDKSFCFL